MCLSTETRARRLCSRDRLRVGVVWMLRKHFVTLIDPTAMFLTFTFRGGGVRLTYGSQEDNDAFGVCQYVVLVLTAAGVLGIQRHTGFFLGGGEELVLVQLLVVQNLASRWYNSRGHCGGSV